MGAPKSSQSDYHGRGGQKINCLHLQWGWLALCPSTAMWGSPSCTTSQEQAPRHPTSGKGAGNLLWADQPTQSLPTACCQPSSHLHHRFEQAWWTHYNHSTRAAGQWYKPYWKQTYLLGDWYPFTPSGGARPKDAPLEDIPTILVTSPPKFPHKLEGSMAMEVSNLLSWAALKHPTVSLNTCPQGGQPQQWTSRLHHRSWRVHPDQLTLLPRPASMRGKPP